MLQGKELIKKALELATKAHKGQYRNDKKTPYIVHPIAVAEEFECAILKSIAYLHDVLEDTDITIRYLLEQGIPSLVVNAVLYLTQEKKQKYLYYILQVKNNCYAKAVKIEDIKHNYPTSHKSKQERYDMALYILKNM